MKKQKIFRSKETKKKNTTKDTSTVVKDTSTVVKDTSTVVKDTSTVVKDTSIPSEPITVQKHTHHIGLNQYEEVAMFSETTPQYKDCTPPVVYTHTNGEWTLGTHVDFDETHTHTRGSISYKGKNIVGIFSNKLFYGKE